MPKPIYGVAGSGMHVNMSLFEGVRNIFDDPHGQRGLSKDAYYFIGGLLAHVRGMSAITNPLVNSYKRLVPGYEAPCYLAWSSSNRSVLIRVPASRGQTTRLELRSPDPSANPYLTLAVCLAAGLDGIKNQMTPPPEIAENIFHMSAEQRGQQGIASLPGSLLEAMAAMREDELVMNTLGAHVAQRYLDGKQTEWAEYSTRVSSWELDRYLVLY